MKQCVFMSAIFLTFKNASNHSQQYVLHSQAKIPTTYMKNLRLIERRRKKDCDHPLASPCVVIMATSGVMCMRNAVRRNATGRNAAMWSWLYFCCLYCLQLWPLNT